MQKLIVSLLTLTLASGVFAAASDPTKTLRLEANEAHKTVRLSTHEGDTPLVRCYLYQNGEAWTLDGTETASLAYSVDGWDEATNMVSIAGTVTANAYVDFQLDGDDTATNGQFYGQIQISDDSPSRSWVWSELRLEIRKSPIGSSGALTLNNPVNWNNTGPYSGTWPFVAGTNITVQATTSNITINAALEASGDITAVNITAGTGLTGTVNTASGDHDQTLSLNAASAASLALADSAVQSESDPIWAAVSNTVTTGAALGATAVQAESDPVWTNAQAVGFTMGGDIDMDTNDITKARAVYTEYIGHPGGEVLPTAHTNIVMIEGGGVQVLDSSGGIAATFQADGNQLFGGILNANLANSTNLPVAGIDATGTPDATTFLRGDGSWQVPAGGGGGGGSGYPRVIYSPDSVDLITGTLSVETYTNALGVSFPYVATDTSTAEWFGDNAGFILPAAATQIVWTVAGRGASAQASTSVLRYSVNRATSWTSLTNTFTSTTSTADYIATNTVSFSVGDIVVWQIDTTTASGDFQHEGILFELR